MYLGSPPAARNGMSDRVDMTDDVYNVSATALFFDRPQPDMGALLTELNTKLAPNPECHLNVSALSHADWWLLTCEQFHVMVSFSDDPLESTDLHAAAISPITGLRRFDYPQAVASHRAHLGIEVGDGHAPLPPEARIIMQEFGESKTCDPELKMQVLYWTTQFIARSQGLLALHFGPSDRVFSPEELAEASSTDGFAMLLRHPVPSLPESGPNGRDGYALQMKNPRHLSGPLLELEGIPVGVPLASAVRLLDTLTRAAGRGKLDLGHGKVLKPSAKISLFVRKELPCERAPDGRFVLSFWADRGHDQPEPMAQPAPVEFVAYVDDDDDVLPAPEAPNITSEQPAAQDLLLRPVETAAAPKSGYDMEREPEPERPSARHGSGVAWLRAPRADLPADLGLKVACLFLVFGMSALWNPYHGFTGGIAVPPSQAFAENEEHPDSSTIVLAAFLN